MFSQLIIFAGDALPEPPSVVVGWNVSSARGPAHHNMLKFQWRGSTGLMLGQPLVFDQQVRSDSALIDIEIFAGTVDATALGPVIMCGGHFVPVYPPSDEIWNRLESAVIVHANATGYHPELPDPGRRYQVASHAQVRDPEPRPRSQVGAMTDDERYAFWEDEIKEAFSGKYKGN